MWKDEIGWQIWTHAPNFPTLWRGMVQQETLLARDLNAGRRLLRETPCAVPLLPGMRNRGFGLLAYWPYHRPC
jgi:hypothetical protein